MPTSKGRYRWQWKPELSQLPTTTFGMPLRWIEQIALGICWNSCSTARRPPTVPLGIILRTRHRLPHLAGSESKWDPRVTVRIITKSGSYEPKYGSGCSVTRPLSRLEHSKTCWH